MKMLSTVPIAERLLRDNAKAALVALGVSRDKAEEMLELAVKTGFSAWFIWIVVFNGYFDVKKITIEFDGSEEEYQALKGRKSNDN